MAGRIRIAVVGDVHGQWDLDEDEKALRFLQADVVLFTGDFATENLDVVKSVSKLKLPKAVILGNHDAGFSMRFSQRSLELVQLQLQLLKEQHVGYSRLDFPLFGFSVVGSRPFSRGSDKIYQHELLRASFGVHNMEESAKKISQAALGTPEGHFLIFLAHNGPAGLGSNRNDICGKDWLREGGDHGDIDLAEALSNLKRIKQTSIPLVVFGHMHKEITYDGGSRTMIKVGEDGTIYLNGAIVPRVHFRMQEGSSMNPRNKWYHCSSSKYKTVTLRAFTMVEIQDKLIERISETWVAMAGSESKIDHETILFERSHSENAMQTS